MEPRNYYSSLASVSNQLKVLSQSRVLNGSLVISKWSKAGLAGLQANAVSAMQLAIQGPRRHALNGFQR